MCKNGVSFNIENKIKKSKDECQNFKKGYFGFMISNLIECYYCWDFIPENV